MLRVYALLGLFVCAPLHLGGGCTAVTEDSSANHEGKTAGRTACQELADRIRKNWSAARYLIVEEYHPKDAREQRLLYSKKPEDKAKIAPVRVLFVSNRTLIKASSEHLRAKTDGSRLKISWLPPKVFRVFVVPEPELPRADLRVSVVDLDEAPIMVVSPTSDFSQHCEFFLTSPSLFVEISRWFAAAETLEGVVIAADT